MLPDETTPPATTAGTPNPTRDGPVEADAGARYNRAAMRSTLAVGLLLVWSAACGSPTTPTPPPPGGQPVGPATPPVVHSIAVPTARVEAGETVTITAVVEDAETPLDRLTYKWNASAGTITGTGATATWVMPAGITKGVDVLVELTVIDTHDELVGGQVVARDFVVVGRSPVFRVHDSAAEQKELARRFLIDLFGDSMVPPLDCLADFSDIGRCRAGKQAELDDIEEHRRKLVVLNKRIIGQTVQSTGPDSGIVRSDAEFIDERTDTGWIGTTCGVFVTTTIYDAGRWWLCESTLDRDVRPDCNTGGVSRIWGQRSR